MPLKLSKVLRGKLGASGVDPAVREYKDRYRMGKRGEWETKETAFRDFTDLYYDLVSDFYEYGWGRSFHFAPRVTGESFRASRASGRLKYATSADWRTCSGSSPAW